MDNTTCHYPRRLGDGEIPSARDWNMLVSRLHASQDDAILTATDVLRLTENADPILARINSGASPSSGRRAYGWNFVNREASGANRDTLHFGGGTTITSPAYESSGRSDVPVDGTAIVWLRPGAGDYYEFTYADRPVWAKLTSSSGANYAWTEVYPSATSATFSALSGGMSGTTSVNPARERNGVTGVAADTIVRLERGYSSGAPQVAINRTQVGNGDDESEIYSIKILNASSGTFTITYEGQTTNALAYNIDAATLETALEALSTITDCEVSGAGTANDPFLVELADDFDQHEIFEAASSLKGDQEWLFISPVANASYDPVDGGTISVSQNNYQLYGTVTFIDVDTTINFTGFVSPTNGKAEVVYVKNVGSKVATFVHESSSSTAANRFHCPTQSDYQLPPQSIGVFKYDTIGLRWQPVLNIPTYAAYTKTQIASDQNDYAMSEYAHVYRLSTDASRTVTGFADGFAGRLLIIENVGSYDLVVANQSSSSTAANRVITGTGANLTLASNQGAFLVYDGTSSRWRVIAHTATTGITSLNGLTAATQTFAVGTGGTDFAVSSATSTHTFNLPDADITARGVVSIGFQEFEGPKNIETDGLDVYGLGDSTIAGGFLSLTDGVNPGVAYRPNVIQINSGYYSMPDSEQTYWRTLRTSGTAWPCGIRFYDPWTSGTPSFGIFTQNNYLLLDYDTDNINPPTIVLRWKDGFSVQQEEQGQTGTSGGGDTVTGGIITALGSGGFSIGDTVGSGTSKYILFVDGSGNLAQSSDFQWDDTAKSLTLGTSGYLVTTKSSAPSGIATGAIAGPFTTS